MAQTVSVTLLDDLDGAEADETVRFGLDGTGYEIDLTAEHAAELRRMAEVYTGAGRKVPARANGARTSRRTQADREHSAAVRAWANVGGLFTEEHGRLPDHVTAAYDAAHAQ